MTSIHRHIHQSALGLLPGNTAVTAMKMWCRKALTRTLLIAYALFLLKPVMPMLMDKLAHTFWMNLHVAVVHKVNGKEHVHYELRKMSDVAGKDKAGLKDRTYEECYALPIIARTLSAPTFVPRSTVPLMHYLCTHADAEGDIVTPPPKSV